MFVGGGRVRGKTTQLIIQSNKEWVYILCANTQRAQVISDMARGMNIDIPHPITARETPLRGSRIKEVLVDDIEAVITELTRLHVKHASTSHKLLELEPLKKD